MNRQLRVVCCKLSLNTIDKIIQFLKECWNEKHVRKHTHLHMRQLSHNNTLLFFFLSSFLCYSKFREWLETLLVVAFISCCIIDYIRYYIDPFLSFLLSPIYSIKACSQCDQFKKKQTICIVTTKKKNGICQKIQSNYS